MKILKWVFGILSLTLGLIFLTISILSGLLLIFCSSLLIPPIFNKINSHLKLNRTIKILLIILTFTSGFIYGMIENNAQVITAFEIMNKKIEEQSRIKKTQELNKNKALDTISIKNYNILFFSPNESEFNELLKKEGVNSGIYEVDSDFGFYSNSVNDSLAKSDVKVKYITERIAILNTKKGIEYFDRLKNDSSPYGIIFNQENCAPRIEYGVMTDIDIFQIWNEYATKCSQVK